ncbi:HNH endonuclease [Pseudoalteromonas sp. CO342X]|uniref:HNH endonuclease n=1 Tax=Pseudoalteromonas sp. CO342X TaxID=1777270 RepID=UPI001023D2DB|nr:HNH endonuclease [Pseudoalteromonas sp. CO342X]RZG16216.1 HNH endonuclease [Pseudoalteromonas sp. CO342X]
MANETRTQFVNRVMGLSFKSTQGKYSYCSDSKKQILFSLNVGNGDVILSPSWSRNGYSHSLKHIDKVINQGYDLLVFETETTKNKKGETLANGFNPLIEKRKLVVEGDTFKAVQIEITQSKETTGSGSPIFEGAKKTITVNAYERDPQARQACLDELGYLCKICEFDFEKTYGERGKEFIHVHHIVPLSEIKSEYEVDPVKDLIPVCPNCHAMLHRKGHTITPNELKSIIFNKPS